MTRGRLKPEMEAIREQVEADLAALGNARVYLQLIDERLRVAIQGNQDGLLGPAVEDLRRADRLICQVQKRIKERS